ncbi:hypothetical protein [Cytobacillus firmus]|nr:hypothetical protein [Cytobacillus firmus]
MIFIKIIFVIIIVLVILFFGTAFVSAILAKGDYYGTSEKE